MAIKFVVKVAVCWVVLNALSVVAVVLWKKYGQPFKPVDGDTMHLWAEDTTSVVADLSVVMLTVVLISLWSAAMMFVGIAFNRYIREASVDPEAGEVTPLLKK